MGIEPVPFPGGSNVKRTKYLTGALLFLIAFALIGELSVWHLSSFYVKEVYEYNIDKVNDLFARADQVWSIN